MQISGSSIVGAFDLRRVGMCARCMRTAFIALAIAWLCVLASWTGSLSVTTPFVFAVAALLTLLWASHVVARAFREIANGPTSRRLALRGISSAVLGAVVVSVALIPSKEARADSSCGGWSGNSGCKACGACQRQTSDCRCYSCRSCGDKCTGNC